MRDRAYTLVTGGAGFIGSNLTDALLSSGERVVVLDNLSRDGVKTNISWLAEKHGEKLRVEVGDILDADRVRALVAGARRVYHLAAQVAVTTSLTDPGEDLRTNLLGTFNVLEAARALPKPPAILFTSTNKVYGGLEHVRVEHDRESALYRYEDGRSGISENEPLDFHSPYGCSKGAADQYVRDYARIYGIPTVVFRMSCIYGTRQFGTEDQGWVAHFARSLLGGAPITIYGDGCQVRDILWIEDLVRAMRAALHRIDMTAGQVFNVGGGAANAISVNGAIEKLMELSGKRVPVRKAPWRPGDQRIYISDTSRARELLDWEPETDSSAGLRRLLEWLELADLTAPVIPLRPRSTHTRAARVAL